MARSQDPNGEWSRARRALPVVVATAAIAVLSLVAVGATSAGADQDGGGGATTTTVAVVECRSDVVTQGDVSMSAMSVTRVDAVPSVLPDGCHVVS